MTRFAEDYIGEHGSFWAKRAKEEIERLEAAVQKGEIKIAENGEAYWKSNGQYLMSDTVEILKHTSYAPLIDEEATARAREAQMDNFIEEYRKTRKITPEERYEMAAAFGRGTTVVDVISGERVVL